MGWSVAGRWAALLLVAAVVVVPATAAVGTGGDASPSTASAQSVERDSVLLRVDVREDGSARWRVEYRTRLDDPATETAFNGLQRSIRAHPENYSAAFFERIHAAIAAAENATGREMSGGNFSVHTTVRRLPQEYGIVVYSYTWRGFAATEGDELRAGDALSGFFLGEDERLLVTWPDGYELRTVEPTADTRREHAVAWSGPAEFGGSEPRVVARERPGIVERWLPVAGAAVAAVTAVLLLAWAVRRRLDRPVLATRRLRERDGEGDQSREPTDPELLSNEERVMRLLAERGGRVKQQDVVAELGWTEAKTSQVVTRLREQGRIESFRLGRENVLSLAGATDGGGGPDGGGPGGGGPGDARGPPESTD